MPLVSEHPAGKIRHHPERLAAAITALAQGKLGAWRGRRRRRGVTKCTNASISCASARSRSAPIPEYLYPSRVHREALDYLRYGLESQAGFVVITGEIGSGKTTLLQTLLRGLDSQTTVGRIVNTMLEPRELLETIMIDFGLEPAGRSKPLMLRDLAQYLVDQRLAGRLVLLVIDEAQNLSLGGARRAADALEPRDREVEAAADRAGRPAEPARQAGGAGARAAAAADHGQLSPARRSIRPRPPTTSTTGCAARRSARRWSSRARSPTSIHARSRGVPRIINVICDAALVFGYAEERRQIDLAADRATCSRSWKRPACCRHRRRAVRRRSWQPDADGRPQPAPAGSAAGSAAGGGIGDLRQELRQAEAASRAAMEQAARRAAEMEQREAALRQRERELAEQRRVLAEEYRLLRVQRAAAATPMAAAAAGHVRSSPSGDRALHDVATRVLGLAEARRHGGSHRAMEGN